MVCVCVCVCDAPQLQICNLYWIISMAPASSTVSEAWPANWAPLLHCVTRLPPSIGDLFVSPRAKCTRFFQLKERLTMCVPTVSTYMYM